MLPQPLRPADEPPPEDLSYPQVRWRRRRLAMRGRVLRFALLAGCGWGAVLALATAIVMSMFPLNGILGDRSNEFFPTFYHLFAGFAPLLVVAAALAAGTQALLHEMRRSASKSRRSLANLASVLTRGAQNADNDSDSHGKLDDLDIELRRTGKH